jgi:hypothetical protein
MLLGVMLVLPGCAGMSQTPPPRFAGLFSAPGSLKDQAMPAPQVIKARHEPAPAKQAERSDVPGCGSNSQCLSRLKALVEDPQRPWIGKPQPAADYAQGIRLFAYRALRAQLTCDELRLALAEIDAAATTYRRPVPGVTPEQTRRVMALSAEVENELRAERARRCSA